MDYINFLGTNKKQIKIGRRPTFLKLFWTFLGKNANFWTKTNHFFSNASKNSKNCYCRNRFLHGLFCQNGGSLAKKSSHGRQYCGKHESFRVYPFLGEILKKETHMFEWLTPWRVKERSR